MSIIEGAAMRCRTMADGSLRIEIEVEPRNAQAAFALFGAPGRAVALAALKDGAQAVKEKPVSEPKERERMGDLCYRAVMWCNDVEFQEWIQVEFDKYLGGNGEAADLVPSGISNADWAKQAILTMCGCSSRKKLDTEESPGREFRRLIVGPWRKHQSARGDEIDPREHA